MILLLLSCGLRSTIELEPQVEVPVVQALNPEAIAGVQDPALQQLVHDHWEGALRRWPTMASGVGDHRYDHRLDSWAPEAWEQQQRDTQALLARAQALQSVPLGEADALTLELLTEIMASGLEVDQACRLWTWAVSPRRNALVDLNTLPDLHPLTQPQEASAYLDRVRAIPERIAQEVQVLRLGLQEGRTPSAESTRRTVVQVEQQLAQPLSEWPLARPTTLPREAWTPEQREAVDRELLRLLDGPVRQAFQSYREVLASELLPQARSGAAEGLTGLPGGEACYRALIREHTSLSISPEDLHQRGLEQLRAVHGEMAVLGQRLFGISQVQALGEHLRSDPSLFFSSAEEVQTTAERSLSRARAAQDQLIATLPRTDCEVRPVPIHEAPWTTVAYYQPPRPNEPGYYMINVYAPETRTRYEAEVLAFHEAIPGHHTQIALSQEMTALPAFRRYASFTAYIEGWALYSERLADEIGLYSSDLDRLGMLSFDSWRASRLVVDTGLHAMGWTREQAVDFLVQNTLLARNNAENEVDRYITTPGQALAYKVGQMHILSQREIAQAQMGPLFDLRAFNDMLLGAGAMTLSALERRVQVWVQAQLKPPPGNAPASAG